MHLTLLVLRCQNIESTKVFYEKLGIIFTQEQHGNSPIHYATKIHTTLLELYPSANDYTDTSRLGFALEIDDIEAYLTKKKIEVFSTYLMNNQKIYVVVDPDGRKVEISK